MYMSKKQLMEFVTEALSNQDRLRRYKPTFPTEDTNALRCIYLDQLNEGLITTYPTNTLINSVIRDLQVRCHTKLSKSNFKYLYPDKSGKIFSTVIVFISNDTFFGEDAERLLRQHFSRAGYVLSDKRHFYGTISYQFDAKYQGESNRPVNVEKAYHITTQEKANKILKIGICPKSNSNKFEYPDRVYLFTKYDLELFKNYVKAALKYSPTGKFAILEVKIDSSMKLYWDPKFGHENEGQAVFTYDNISPDKLLQISSFSI